MNKNYKYYYATHKLPSSQSNSRLQYENEYNDEYDAQDYYEGNCDSENYNHINCAQRTPEVIAPQPKVQPPAEPSQSNPRPQNKLPYCIVPVLYVPKRIVQKEEIARNKVLQSSLASLSRMENLFYKYKANYESDISKQATQAVDMPIPQIPQRSCAEDYINPNALANPYTDNGSYYDTQYEYCTSATSCNDNYVANYRRPEFQETFQDDHKAVSVVPKLQTSISNSCNYNYDRDLDPFVNRKCNPYEDPPYYDRHSGEIHQYTRDWLGGQGRRLQTNIQPAPYRTYGNLPRNLKNIHTNTTIKPASFQSIGVNATSDHESRTSQTSRYELGCMEQRNIYCEAYTQTEPTTYIATVTQRLRSPSAHREAKPDFCERPNDLLLSHTRSATLIPKLKPILHACTTADSAKPCIHERNSCDSRQRSHCQKQLRGLSPEGERKY